MANRTGWEDSFDACRGDQGLIRAFLGFDPYRRDQCSVQFAQLAGRECADEIRECPFWET